MLTVNGLENFANPRSCLSNGTTLFYGIGIPVVILLWISLFYALRAIKATTLDHEKTKVSAFCFNFFFYF